VRLEAGVDYTRPENALAARAAAQNSGRGPGVRDRLDAESWRPV